MTDIEKKIGTASLKTIAVVVALYFCGLFGAGFATRIDSPLVSRNQIEEILNEEKRKLGIKEDIKVNIVMGDYIPHTKKTNEKEYEIYLPKGSTRFCNFTHELYHVKDWDEHGDHETGYYLFWGEPMATIYSLKNRKMGRAEIK